MPILNLNKPDKFELTMQSIEIIYYKIIEIFHQRFLSSERTYSNDDIKIVLVWKQNIQFYVSMLEDFLKLSPIVKINKVGNIHVKDVNNFVKNIL